jgi:hypothetical protein
MVLFAWSVPRRSASVAVLEHLRRLGLRAGAWPMTAESQRPSNSSIWRYRIRIYEVTTTAKQYLHSSHQTQTHSKWYEMRDIYCSILTNNPNRPHRTPPASRRCSMYVYQGNTPTRFHTESHRSYENFRMWPRNSGIHA